MSVFNSASKTTTELATGLGKHDYSLTTNPMGGINLTSGITSDSALSPTLGVDCTLDHGNAWEEIDSNGKKQVDVANAYTLDVGGTFTIDVTGDQDITITGNLNQEVYGTSTYTYAQSLDSTNIMTVTNNFASVQAQQNPSQHFTMRTTNGAIYDVQFVVAAVNTSLSGILMLIAMQRYAFIVSHFGINAMTFQVNGLSVPAHGLNAKIEAFGTRLHGLALNAGGPKIVGYAAKLLGCAMLGPNQVL